MALTKIGDAGMPAGAVLQVKQTVVDTTLSVSGTTAYTDTGLSVSITPTSTSSKIFVMSDLALGITNSHGSARLLRDSTVLYKPASPSSREEVAVQIYSAAGTDHAYSIQRSTITFLDSPSTTSAVTYKMQIGTPSSSGYAIYMNRQGVDTNNAFSGHTASSITVMEIAG